MKKITLGIIATLGAAALLSMTVSSCNTATAPATKSDADSTAVAGSIVFFNLDRILLESDMANDLRSVAETKVNSINEDVNRRGSKLEKEIKSFQDKIQRGVFTQTVAAEKSKKLQEDQNRFQQYAAQKQQEIADLQQDMMGQIADAIKTFIDEYNAVKGYAMILTTQGEIMPAPVVTADPALDITDDILEGLNAAYVKSKTENKD